MRTVYKIVAGLVAVEVVVQAMAIVLAVAGEGKWIEDGGVLDKAVVESQETVFPEVIGYAVHGINGTTVIPLTALILLVVSFFAKTAGAVKWAGLVLLLVAVQALLGIFSHVVPALGALHGLNALLLFLAAIRAARLGRDQVVSPVADSGARLTAQP
ncbi:hypothetical protein [Microbispora sp. ATCC PTA-5024]|uniref:hypothetical protein n=1 Tax=Microbispora sp. ATCC PTA-5024 TaxID=316330 RepID=UPI0003DC4446|nr:hypothetical protein [Microbispora sp. ATCC PTA-5024]ETK34185.1 hypothetical protein MPTA5024_20770 [Microbispora sp. ATCC PTA-5024]